MRTQLFQNNIQTLAQYGHLSREEAHHKKIWRAEIASVTSLHFKELRRQLTIFGALSPIATFFFKQVLGGTILGRMDRNKSGAGLASTFPSHSILVCKNTDGNLCATRIILVLASSKSRLSYLIRCNCCAMQLIPTYYI